MSVYLGNEKILEGVLGQKGIDGTPVKGVDYYNAADKNALIETALNELYSELDAMKNNS